MSESLFHPSWYRVATLAPRLRSHTEIHRHHYRGERWYVLQNHASGRFFRFSPAAHFVISMMDGRRRIEEIWQLACERLGDEAPTQGEVVRMLAQLHEADALLSAAVPDEEELVERARSSAQQRKLAYFRNPLALRIPLWDPDRFVQKILPAVGWLFGPTGAVLWLLLFFIAVFMTGVHWGPLTENVTERVLSLENLLLLWLVVPAVKFVHEIGHAIAVRRFGGEVHEMGIMLLVLVPIPFVDATAASGLRRSSQRALIGAAGMLAELALAALALVVWANVEPGVVRAVAFNVVLVAGVSTLLFNLNPLLRFDGYYILSDLIQIPNLGPRANRYLGYLANRYAFGKTSAFSSATTDGERRWFVGYGITSFLYRAAIVVIIITFVGTQYFLLGILLALWALYVLIVRPLWQRISYVLFDGGLAAHRRRAVAVCAGTLFALVALVGLVPLPLWTNAQGVVWLPDEAWVRPASDGFVRDSVARAGQEVGTGEALLHRDEPVLRARVGVLEATVVEAQARLDAVTPIDRVRAQILEQELALARAQLSQAQEQAAALTVVSPGNGVFWSPYAAEDWIGRFSPRGRSLGVVIPEQGMTARIVVGQDQVDLVRSRTRGVSVLLASALHEPMAARLVRETPGASNVLPSAALSIQGGGAIALDPRRGDELAALQPVFSFDIELPREARAGGAGERVYVRIFHGREVLALRWYRWLRRLLLSQFDV